MTHVILYGIAIMSLSIGVTLVARQRQAAHVLVQQPGSGRLPVR
ncbi:MAG: hypothetical protein OJF52_004017 [Nitrospira sp.]|jgi:LPS O-antigen subunit length determinant protein (WzzB/FepE family)|nr:MAG: hypothetical protein OJF52_004017 [Nitrospira sp.]